MWTPAPLLAFSQLFSFQSNSVVENSVQQVYELPRFAAEPGVGSLPSCSDPTIKANIEKSQYQYLVIGAGAGGGTVAARLANDGYTVGLIEAGKDHVNMNTTIPLYLIRATEDPVIALDYEVDHYPYRSADDPNRVTAWYPRAQGIGGSTIHNALINLIPHKWDFEQIRKMFDDDSWSWENMAQYYTKIEKNEYIAPGVGLPIGHGYSGWMETQTPPLSLLQDYPDQQLGDIFTALTTKGKPPVRNFDYNDWRNDEEEGGAYVILTKQANGTRLTVRDRVVDVRTRFPERLKLITETMATKILSCRTEKEEVQAYGVEVWIGPNLLNVARNFKGKGKGVKMVRQLYAKNEVILSAGPYESPRLMMLSGLGDRDQLRKNNLTTLVHLPGVGQNLQGEINTSFTNRVEETTVFHLKKDHRVFANCTFGYDPETDPCLNEWYTGGRKNLYSAGAALWAWSYKSNASLPYRDVWNFWGPAQFLGYYKGWGEDARKVKNAMVNVILKAHTAAQGWVRLTSPDPQAPLDINKNEFVTPESLKDLEVVKDGMKFTKKWVDETPLFNQHVKSIPWPPSSVVTDQDYKDFIRANQWGHHACCTNKIGADNDSKAVLNGDFQVRGVKNLRIVDLSSWPTIPGMFVTTPMYMIAEKAAEVIGDFAEVQNKGPEFL